MARGHPAGRLYRRQEIAAGDNLLPPDEPLDVDTDEPAPIIGTSGSSRPVGTDRLILDCPNCGHVTVN